MQLNSSQEIAVPASVVFDAITDFEAFERRAESRMTDVQRSDSLTAPGVGMRWSFTFTFRGTARAAQVEITEYIEPTTLQAVITTGGLRVTADADIVTLGPERSRLNLTVNMASSGIAGKLLLQSLKLARGKIEERVDTALARFARDLEKRASA
ncbi:MAG: SRPBCC family protein [Shimia sp.]